MSILDRVRASGKCPPSLIGGNPDNDFETAALKVVDANGMSVVRLTSLLQYCPMCVLFRIRLTFFIPFSSPELYLSFETTVPVDFKALLEVR